MPSDPTPYTVPISRVRAFAALANYHGWDLEEMLQKAGVNPSLLLEGRSRITVDQTANLLRQLWRATDDELLGLGPKPVPRGTFRLLCFAILTSGTLREAIDRFADFARAAPGVPATTITTVGGEARVGIDIGFVDKPVDFLVDTLLVIWHRFLAWSIGREIRLHSVEVTYPKRPDIDDYDVLFGAPVTFSAPMPTLVFSAELLTAPIVRDEDALNRFMRDAPAGILTRRNYATSVSSQVRALLAQGLTGDLMSIEEIAMALMMSPQTLRRKLREENTTPREIREAILRDEAIASLARGEETVAALSRRLGFSEPSAFSRAFRRWTGSPPGSYQH